MNTLSNQERMALREAMSRLMREQHNEAHVRKVSETAEGFDKNLWRQLSEMGITGLMIDEEYGGSGVGPLELEAIMEEAGSALLSAPLLASSVVAAELLRVLGDADVNKRLLPSLASGEKIVTAVLTGDSGCWTPTGVSLQAKQSGKSWTLSGRGNYVLHGQNADVLIVIATENNECVAFEVDAQAQGISVTPLPTFDRTLRLASIDFDQVVANKINHTASVDDAFNSAVTLGLIALAGEQAGGAKRVLDDTIEYAKTRVQFGRAIGSFQAIKHMAADLLLETESAISAARDAAAALAEGRVDVDEAVSLAAFACADAYVKTTADSVQMHGGIAFTWEHPTHLYVRRARATAQLFGDSNQHRERYLQTLEA